LVRLTPPDTRESQFFGNSVAFSSDGTVLAVGAEADSIGFPSGAAYVFSRDPEGSAAEWVQETYLKPIDVGVNVGFGRHLSLSGDGSRLAVGACFDSTAGTGVSRDANQQQGPQSAISGAVHLFSKNEGIWISQSYVKPSNTAPGQRACQAVLSHDGSTLAVGAFEESSVARNIGGDQTDRSGFRVGAVYLY
jgi:hypothetical protein